MTNSTPVAPRPAATAGLGGPSGALANPLSRWRNRPKRPPRWGLRASLSVTLSVIALFTAEAQGFHTVGTLACTVIGIMGGGYCSFRGLRAVIHLEGITGKKE